MKTKSLLFIFSLIAALHGAAADPPAIVSRIARQPVQSTAVASVGYSKRLHVLEIEFTNGAIYRYVDVPRAIHLALMSAESKARFYHANIKGRFHSLCVRPRPKKKPAN